MLHVFVIALFLVLMLHDAAFGGVVSASAHTPWWVWGASLGPMLVLGLATHGVLGLCAAELDRSGSPRALRSAERMLTMGRWTVVMLHALNVLVLGFLDAIRSVIGDTIGVDEVLCVLPALTVVTFGWWSFYPIELRLREASLLRTIDSLVAVHPIPTRGEYVVMQVRHQLLLSVLPIGVLSVWSEAAESLLKGLRPDWLGASDAHSLVLPGVQLLGVLMVFTFAPVVMRRVWDTRPLEAGELRERLMAMCTRAGVRVRELLVWRTHGTMINGAVLGLFAPLRSILLTDALLEQLPQREVEAVMAHEIAHARYAHMPWLAGAMIASVGLASSVAGEIVVGTFGLFGDDLFKSDLTAWSRGAILGIQIGVAIGSLVVGLVLFGAVSRRFEWQADAFAAKQLSDNEFGPAFSVTQDGVSAMAGALESVAVLNHIAPARRSWRHGSIRARQKRLALIVGRPATQLPIDSAARWIKRITALGLLTLGVLTAREALQMQSAPRAAVSGSASVVPPGMEPSP